jgi:hypothetical protein
MSTLTDDDNWNVDECLSRADATHRERKRVARELEKTREQDRKQWEFENGGRNPIGNDPDGLNREEQEMYRRLGEEDMRNERNSQEDSLLPFLIIICVTIGVFYLYNKHFG